MQTHCLSLAVSARADDGTVMAIRHKAWPTVGVQFHPESIGTEHGQALVQNFLGPTDRS